VIEFETDRLRLRQWRAEDFEPFAQMNADPRVMEFFPAPIAREASDASIERWQSQLRERGWSNWAVELQEGGAFIGFVGLSVPRAKLPFMPCVEIGWRLAFDHWGNGYATEAAMGSLGIAFQRLHLPEVVSFTTIHNLRSRAVMERIGMRDTGANFEHPACPPGNRLRLHCLYRVRSTEWPV
jgi:RimJ/RimL family protein N-acetyltransferase